MIRTGAMASGAANAACSPAKASSTPRPTVFIRPVPSGVCAIWKLPASLDSRPSAEVRQPRCDDVKTRGEAWAAKPSSERKELRKPGTSGPFFKEGNRHNSVEVHPRGSAESTTLYTTRSAPEMGNLAEPPGSTNPGD